jgi:branched-chain amino acid transport system permease protein
VRLKAKPSTLIAALIVAAAVLFVVTQNRGPAAFDSASILTFLVVGVSLGGIYAITALGLVVTYSTTGIFNFAHGAIGAFLAFTYWELRVNRGWPAPLALVIVVFVFAPLLGIVLDKLLMQRLRNATLVVQLMVTVGLMLSFMGITLTVWKPTQGRSLPHFFRDADGIDLGEVTVTWHRVITVGVALFIAFALRAILYRTRTGIAMRAVVDNRTLAGLNGAKPSVISGASWALGCMTAAIAGILVAPETGMVVENLTLMIVIAFAAAAIAQLKSLPWAFAGGMIIGLAKAFTGQFIAFDQNWSYAQEAIPAVILLIALLFLTKRTERLTSPLEALTGAFVIVGIVVAWANGWIPWFTGTNFGERSAVWLGRGAGFMVIGLIMLSLVPLIGWAGQVSFANFAIAGFGAAMYAHLGGQDGDPLALVWVALICAPLGVVVEGPVPGARHHGVRGDR